MIDEQLWARAQKRRHDLIRLAGDMQVVPSVADIYRQMQRDTAGQRERYAKALRELGEPRIPAL
ncbi:MAG: hypothetical protein OXC11_00755 [Rhodospirillales bacterium]|nr:hypothetical protein [Rhodospirillales bacterium]